MILDLIALDNSARVWLYQADRELTYDELEEIRESMFSFLKEWTCHNHEMATYGNVFHRRFLGLFVDGTRSTSASGCSIDASVNWVQSIGSKLNVDFFNRTLFTYMDSEENIYEVKQSELGERYAKREITDEMLFFDNLVTNKENFLQQWLVPLKDSWHKRMI